MEIDGLIRSHIKHLKPYSSARDEFSGTEGVFLDANENPFGSSTNRLYNRYPDPYQTKLKSRIAILKDIPAGNIFLGNGSDEPIDLIIRLFCNPGKDQIMITPPTYGMYEVAAEINETEVLRVPLSSDFQLQPEKILNSTNERTKLLFLCSPNNPTGNTFDKEQILFLIGEFRGIVVLDEAYIDFCPDKSLINELENFHNLIILQTFSKAWGLAGLRLGMAFAHPKIIQYLNKIKPPYNISEVTQELAIKAVDNVKQKKAFVHNIRKELMYLREKLKQIPCVVKIYDSDANFILARFNDSNPIFNYLTENHIIVRDRSQMDLCENTLRITAGTRKENETLLSALKKFNEIS